MKNNFHMAINAIIAALLTMLGYGCSSKKAVVDSTDNKQQIDEPVLLMYGPPSYFEPTPKNYSDTIIQYQEEPPISIKYGVREPVKKYGVPAPEKMSE